MALNSRLFGSISVIVVATMIWDCMGIIAIRDLKLTNPTQRQKSRPKTMCKFGNKSFTIGQKWNPYLEPIGIIYCITCRCKKHGLTHCAKVKCRQISCPGKMIPSGKCCPVCPSPQRGVVSKKQCHDYDGKRYRPGEVWYIQMNNQDAADNNCAECTCNNGRVSCAVRICPTLTCAPIMQVRGKDSCCSECHFPLRPVGGPPKPAITVQGSCFDKGRYYKDNDMWNPLAPMSEAKVFQQPNCDLCICQNATVKCKKVVCPKLECDNPVQKNTKDCCRSCPDIKPVIRPIMNHTLPQNVSSTKPRDSNCKFLSKIYKHNSSWTPQIPGHDPSSCVRCTCEFSRIKCNRNGCGVKTSSDNQDAKSSPKPSTEKPLCSSGDGVLVYLFVNENSKRLKAKQNYIARIAVIDPKVSFVTVHFWDVADTKVMIKISKPRKTRFERRKTNYLEVGETKIGRINRFFNKEKTLEKCNRSCKSKARDFIKFLKNRVRYMNTSCKTTKPIDLFKRLKENS